MAAKKKKTVEAEVEPKAYAVAIPFTGVMTVYVDDAADEEQAKKAAFEKVGVLRLRAINDARKEPDDVEIETWEPHERIVKGNVFCGVANECEVYEA